MYCKKCELYSALGITKETFCSECLEQKIVNDRSTSGICEDCSKKLNLCTLCGDSLFSEEEIIQMQAENSNNENSNTGDSLESLLLERQNSMPLAKQIPMPPVKQIAKNKIKPITPQKALDMFIEHISKFVSDELLDAVNELLIERYKIQGDGCTISAKDIIERCNEKMAELDKDFPNYSERTFNFMPLYEENGWLVDCDMPENGDVTLASFKFSVKSQNESS